MIDMARRPSHHLLNDLISFRAWTVVTEICMLSFYHRITATDLDPRYMLEGICWKPFSLL